ncbi:nitrogen fixation protein NifQ [uncultured Vibrio sp.]|uniref:nitrogen fixation protein NifQ n=1 Tax=uncultured Vibrio sp. TaxID=114054 RepID=UPI0029C9AC66|nr:nitrogen fixation protein NifQ [uncultured Vibrio sp.]
MHDKTCNQYWRPIVHSYLSGRSALPLYLGLEKSRFTQVIEFFGFEVNLANLETKQATLRCELMALRTEEYDQLRQLLSQNLANSRPFAEEMAIVISSGCMGSQHLWHDLGLPERVVLTHLFSDYFPTLFTANVNNMRWKRFLYRQLCESGGDYVCRSPSCETCSSYNECFETVL